MKNYLLLIVPVFFAVACDHGLAPVDEEGEIHANITYVGEGPDKDAFYDLRFVAMRFVPESTTDFLRLEELEISDELETHVDQQRVVIEDVRNGMFFYSGVAWQFSPNIFQDWRVLGLYEDNGNEFTVRGDVVEIDVVVDFDDLPDFPPEDPL